MDTFIDKSPRDNEARIDVEPFCGSYILRVDGHRIGHALTDEQVAQFKYFLALALPDLEAFFRSLLNANNT